MSGLPGIEGANNIGVAATEACKQIISAFDQWAEGWSRLGIWLSLWDQRAELIQQSETDGLFWDTLIRQSRRCRQRLRQIVSQAIQDGETLFVELDHGTSLYIQAIPLFYRQRVIGVVLACGLSHDFGDDENFSRFCNVNHIDKSISVTMSAHLPRHSIENLHTYADILTHHTKSFIDSVVAQRDIHNLSSHLARVYEELNLIFRIGTDISISKGPTGYFERLGEELVGTTGVKAFTVILNSPADFSNQTTVIRSGPIPATDEQLLKLHCQVRQLNRNANKALVVNDVQDYTTLKWASDWLKRFIYFDLAGNNQTFGGLFAINHVGSVDFGSEEIQLLNTIVERSSSFLENVRLYNDLEQLMMGMLHALVSSTDAKDPYTCGHSQRVAWLSRYIADLDGKSEETCQRIYLSGLLHDIGKIGVSESVLCKKGDLTAGEFEQMKQHSQIGARILGEVREVEDLIPGVLHHHERIDGSGYPRGLKGEDIPYLGRVIGLADCFDAMTSDRTYRNARPTPMAVSEIRRYAGTQFDPHLADLLLREDISTIRGKMALAAKHPFVAHAGMEQVT
ncbi:MAG: HD domain-containing protein [Planctomycetota bacterium]|nr:MAG: HD domain-containing protein [Planctomycetota bacterium]